MQAPQPGTLASGNEIQHIELDRLKQHPGNEEVYGSCESITALVESIKLKGYEAARKQTKGYTQSDRIGSS